MTINIKELQNYFQEIIAKLQNEDVEVIELKTDYYLNITADEWEDFENAQPVTGSLIDDINTLNENISNNVFTYVDFDRVSSILRAISQELNPV